MVKIAFSLISTLILKFDDGNDLVGDVVDAPGEVVGVEEAMHGTWTERRPPGNHSQGTRNRNSCPLNYF